MFSEQERVKLFAREDELSSQPLILQNTTPETEM